MPNASVVEPVAVGKPCFDLTIGGRLAMVALGYIPLMHASLTVIGAVLIAKQFGMISAVTGGTALLYLLPPLATVLARPRSLLKSSRCSAGSRGFFRWWYATQWQVVFNRFPALEEVLRMVPGSYSAWLRLWGAKVGGLVYWSPGVRVFDRPFLQIGSRVVIGAQTSLCPHIVAKDAAGNTELLLGPISIGDDALVGGHALIPAGVSIDACQQTPGGRPMAPFATFRNGRHWRTTRVEEQASS
jgi:hypothetical protein